MHDVRVRIMGELHLLPERVQRAAAQVMLDTAGNSGCQFNVCLAYTCACYHMCNHWPRVSIALSI